MPPVDGGTLDVTSDVPATNDDANMPTSDASDASTTLDVDASEASEAGDSSDAYDAPEGDAPHE